MRVAFASWSAAAVRRLLGWSAQGLDTRTELIRAASRAPLVLGEAASLVRAFFLEHLNDDGGFRGRTDRSDLYYTVFALDGLLALGVPVPIERTASYLASFGTGESLDFVHLCCLARCYAALRDAGAPEACKPALGPALLSRVEKHRSADGGYHPVPGQAHGTAYAAFLALGAYGDLQTKPPRPHAVAHSLEALRTPDGAWANERQAPGGSTNPTAAALAVLAHLGVRANFRRASGWLLAQAHSQGGFRASPLSPIPDLLSTATALHALVKTGAPIEPIRERCLDFIDTLWSNAGGFHGHWNEEVLDVEYTFYGLLALGHLS